MVVATQERLSELQAEYSQAITDLRTKTNAPLSITDCDPIRRLARSLLDKVIATDFLKCHKDHATMAKCDVYTNHRHAKDTARVLRLLSQFAELGYDVSVPNPIGALALAEEKKIYSVRMVEDLWMEMERLKVEHQ